MSVLEAPSPKPYVALIVCSDDRSKTLAARLAASFQVYVVQSNGASSYIANDLVPMSTEDLPENPDLLFFHTGGNDPDRIPLNCKPRLEFAFSGGDEPFTTREKAYKIFPPFIGEQCPVDGVAITQIIELLEGKRKEPPEICVPSRTDSPLAALAVLCQGYLAVNAELDAGLNQEERNAVEAALERMGWHLVRQDQSLKVLLKNLSVHKKRVDAISWWARPFLSTWGDSKTPSGLNVEGLISGLKDEWKKIGGDRSKFSKVKELVRAFTQTAHRDEPTLTLSTVAAAYTAIANTLLVEDR